MDNKKTIVIHQPDFMPHMGFFHRLLCCDVYVILDHVQLLSRGWHHRDKIKGPAGPVWLTVPIKKIKNIQRINEAEIDYSHDWSRKHLNMLEAYYRKALYFEDVYPAVCKIYRARPENLVDLNIALLDFFMRYFGIEVRILHSSDWHVETHRNQMNIEIVKLVGGNVYLSGTGAKDYLDESIFIKEGIDVIWQEYECPVYPQLHGQFVPGLSCIDFAMNCGNKIREYLNINEKNRNNSAGTHRLVSSARKSN